MHCSGCGLIMGRDSPPDLCSCPRCGQVLRVQVFDVEDDRDRPQFRPVLDSVRRFVDIYSSAVMVGLEVAGKTPRAEAWAPFLIELEEERLKSFARSLGWTIAAVYRDPGPSAADDRRPFRRIRADLEEGTVNTILVSDFAAVTRKAMRDLWEMTRRHGAPIVSIAPHVADPNLVHDTIDYDAIPDSVADHPELDRLWNRQATETVHKLFETVGWHWTHYAPDFIARAIGITAIKAWRDRDPACRRSPWKEVLTRYAVARMRRAGDLARLPLPVLKSCTRCHQRFLDSALPVRLMELSSAKAEHCPRCLSKVFYDGVAVPPAKLLTDTGADLDEATEWFRELDPNRFDRFLRTVLERLDQAEIKGTRFKPSDLWLDVLHDMGYLERYGEITPSDRLFKAADGHLSSSLGGALLDNWLTSKGLAHRPDARYPLDSELNPAHSMRADYVVGDVLVEFVGLRGRDEFEKGMAERVALARRHGKILLALTAEDLLVPKVMERKAAGALGVAAKPATKTRGEA